MNKCKVKKIAAMLVFAGVVLAGLYAQTPDQSALLQALGGAQGGQGATGAAGGAAGVTVPPAVSQLSAPSAGTVQTKTTEPKAASAQALSAIERMFASMAAGLGTPAQNLTQFGYSLFDTPSAPSFAAIGDDYVLGPGDGLVLYLWGDAVDLRELSPSYTLTVDRNGAIFLPPVGQVSIWGQDIGSVRGILKSMLDRRYKRLEMNLTLGTLRQFPVFVSGYAGSPGTVLANGADTVLTVLSRAGGILKTGSLRSVVLTRQGKGGASERIEIDFYESLLQGKPIDLRVREGDSIFIPGIGPVVALAGELRLPGIYELKQGAPKAAGASLEAALALAGGVLPSARSGAVTLLRYGEAGKELVTGNIQDRAFAGRQAVDGDFIYFGKISDLLLGQVEVSGAARYPGRYDIASFRSLKALLQKAQLLPETNLYYGRVYRMDQSGKDRSFAFSPGEVLAAGEGSAGAAADVPLAEFDRVVLYRYADTGIDPDLDRFENTVVVSGPVKYPGFYLYKSGMKLSSVLNADQLLLDTNQQYGEIVRLRKDGKHEYVTFRPGEVVAGKWDLELGSRDVIRLVKVGYRPAQVDMERFVDSVMVEGPVEFGGVYAWREGMRLGELMKLAKPKLEANRVYAEVVRPLAGGKHEYVTFALREVEAGVYDTELKARDRVRLYSTAAVLTVGKAGAQEGGTAVAGTEGAPAVGTGVQEGGATAAAAQAGAQTAAPASTAGVGIETDLGAFLEVVQVSGAIRYQGPYARTPSLKLSSVVTVEQILEETNLEYAELTRLRADGTPEYHTFSPKAVLEGRYDLALQAKDSIRFVKKASFGGKGESPDFEKFSEVVQLTGQAARPEVYALRPGMKLSEVVTKDQLLLDTNQQYGEIVRLRKDGKHEYVTFRPGEVVAGKWDLELGSRDVIRLVKVGYRPAQVDMDRFVDSVMVEGPVEFGGVYAWREGMRLGELIKLAKPKLEANQVYAEVVRPLAGGKHEYVTFALREVEAGVYDTELKARDRVRLYSTAAVLTVGKAGAQEGGTAVAGTEGAPAVGTGVQEGGATAAAAQAGAQTAAPASTAGVGIETDLGAFLEVVQVSGAIRYQGPYARTPSLKLSSVVTVEQILEETNLEYAELTRLRADGTPEYHTFSPKAVLEGNYDLALQAKDSIRFVKKASFGGKGESPDFEKFSEVVQLTGQAARPEVYALRPGMKLSEVVTKDQLLLDTNQQYGEIVRLRKDGKHEYVTFRPGEVVAGKWDLELGSRDVIRLVKVGYRPAQVDMDRFVDSVMVEGPVEFGGVYAWREGMRLGELMKLAKPKLEANRVYAEVVRPLGGGKNEYVTFALREVEAGVYDTELKARDRVRLYSTAAVLTVGKAGVQEGGTAVAGTEGAPAVGTGVQEGAASPAAASVPAGTGSGIETDLGAFLEVVQVSGAIRYQGPYARTPSLKLSSVVTVEQILEETNLEYAELTRLRADGTPEYHTFSPKAVLEGNYDLALQAKDSIRFVKKASFGGKGESPDFEKFSEVVQLTGQAARPEVYALRPGMKLSEVVTKDQLLLDTNQQYGEIVRLRKDGKHEYVTFRPGEVVAGKWDLELGSRDVIRLVKVGYRPAQVDMDRFVDSVMVEGPVEFGGVYAWREGMRLGELMKLAKPKLEANQVYAEVVRPLAGGKNEYVTFALREVEAGVYDTELKARDRVRLYSTAVVSTAGKQGAAEVQGGVAPAVGAGTATAEGTAAPMASAPAAGAASGSIETDTGFYLEVIFTSGTIRYQGPYARTPSLMLSSVVTRDQILQETSLDYAELTRRKPDGSWEYLTFAPRDVLNGEFDLKLRAMDSIRFVPVKYLPEKFDFDKFGNAFAIVGSANYPGLYSLGKRRMLSEIITQDQLISTTDNFYAEIERWSAGGRIEYLTFNPTAVLNGKQDFPIMPRDIIRLVPEGGTGEAHNFARYPDTVLVKGVIRYPSRYAWYRGMRLSDIIQESDLLIDTETGYAEIKRYGQNTDSIINFAPAQLAAGKADFELMPRDIVIFYPKYYYRPISVAGEVAEPKIIPYFENIELSSVLRSVVLLRDMANLKAEIKKQSGETTEVYLEDYLKRQPDRKVLLAPGDAITIKQLLPNEHLPVVVVRGEVKEPKTLAFKEGMRLADALRDAGGYESTAYQKGIVLIRKSVADAQQKQIDRLIAQLEAATSAGSVLPSAADTALNSASAVIANLQIDLAIQKSKLGNLKQVYKEGFGRITLEIPDTLEELEASPANIRLERDDLIFVPKMPTFVIVSGEVASQNVVLYREGMTVRQAIAESGWLSKEADLANAFIIRASGKLDSTEGKGFLWFKPNILNYRLNPGDTVFVPTKSAKVSVAWAYLRDSFMIISTVLTSALTAKTLLGL